MTTMFRRRFLGLAVGGAAVLAGGLFFARKSGATPENAVTLAELDEAITSGNPVLVHFTSPWCVACMRQKPVVADLLGQPDFATLRAFEVDFGSQRDILVRHQVTRQATILVFREGEEVDRMTGQTDAAVIEALLRRIV